MFNIEDSTEQLEKPMDVAHSHLEGTGLSKLEKDYLGEAINSNKAEFMVSRIDEISDDRPPRGIDHRPEIKDMIGNKIKDLDSMYLEAPNDIEQVTRISKSLENMEGTSFKEWKEMTFEKKLSLMQKIENTIAEITHRPPCKVTTESLGKDYFGFYQNETKTITLNSDYFGNDYQSYLKTYETIVHEGRHAYQYYNINTRQVHPSDGDCTNWKENLFTRNDRYSDNCYGYQNYAIYGFQRYYMQPVETDARAFAEDVLSKFLKFK